MTAMPIPAADEALDRRRCRRSDTQVGLEARRPGTASTSWRTARLSRYPIERLVGDLAQRRRSRRAGKSSPRRRSARSGSRSSSIVSSGALSTRQRARRRRRARRARPPRRSPSSCELVELDLDLRPAVAVAAHDLGQDARARRSGRCRRCSEPASPARRALRSACAACMPRDDRLGRGAAGARPPRSATPAAGRPGRSTRLLADDALERRDLLADRRLGVAELERPPGRTSPRRRAPRSAARWRSSTPSPGDQVQSAFS